MFESKLIGNASRGERNTALKFFLMWLILIEFHARFSQVAMIEGIGDFIKNAEYQKYLKKSACVK